jgi:hypothetical protein
MIIGLVGFINSGKGTVGTILQNEYGFKPESFAKPLKDACAAIFGWDRALLEGDTPESRYYREQVDGYWAKVLNKPTFTPRLALQWMGTEAGRNVFGENLWTASCIRRCEMLWALQQYNTVVTDCRFVNEIKAIKDAGGVVVRVRRGQDPLWMRFYLKQLTSASADNLNDYMAFREPELHQSEWDWVNSLDKIDYTIENIEGNPASMKDALSDILHEIKLEKTTS